MPTEFLTDAQERAYGHYVGPPSNQQLAGYFHLDDADLELVNVRRGAHNKLGVALQLTTARFLGTFLVEPTDVPAGVVAYVAAQLGIHDVACLAEYGARSNTAWDHAAEIRRVYGYRDFSDPYVSFPLVRWLYTRAWLSAEQPSMLFDLATAWLVEHQVVLPGVSVLAVQVNTGERRHGLARRVFHGRRGELRQAYRVGQEDQLGALGLVLNAIVVWNTRYMGWRWMSFGLPVCGSIRRTSSDFHRLCTTTSTSTGATASPCPSH